MSDQELKSITVWLAGRSYRIKVHPEDEANVLRAVKAADEKVMELRQFYSGKDDQDFLAMSLITYATQNVSEPFDHPLVNQELKELTEKINSII